MWILAIITIVVSIAIAIFSGLVTFALNPIGSILNLLRIGSFLLAVLTGVLTFLFEAPFDTFGWIFLTASAAWVLLLFVPEPRPRY